MKRLAFFLVGAAAGFVGCFVLLYLSGLVLAHLGVQLYASEADQQRNFNVFLFVGSAAAVVAGILAARKAG